MNHNQGFISVRRSRLFKILKPSDFGEVIWIFKIPESPGSYSSWILNPGILEFRTLPLSATSRLFADCDCILITRLLLARDLSVITKDSEDTWHQPEYSEAQELWWRHLDLQTPIVPRFWIPEVLNSKSWRYLSIDNWLSVISHIKAFPGLWLYPYHSLITLHLICPCPAQPALSCMSASLYHYRYQWLYPQKSSRLRGSHTHLFFGSSRPDGSLFPLCLSSALARWERFLFCAKWGGLDDDDDSEDFWEILKVSLTSSSFWRKLDFWILSSEYILKHVDDEYDSRNRWRRLVFLHFSHGLGAKFDLIFAFSPRFFHIFKEISKLFLPHDRRFSRPWPRKLTATTEKLKFLICFGYEISANPGKVLSFFVLCSHCSCSWALCSCSWRAWENGFQVYFQPIS